MYEDIELLNKSYYALVRQIEWFETKRKAENEGYYYIKFAESGILWEFNHPHGGHPTELQRKPYTEFNQPCREYMGHNPLIAMTDLWSSL